MEHDITQLLKQHHAGDRAAFDTLVPLVYARLKDIAQRQRRRAGEAERTLCTTALVQEAYIQLVGETGVDWQGRAHFFAISARAMRRILVDAARRRASDKRGGGLPDLSLRTDLAAIEVQADDILAVDLAIDGLREFNERLAQVVECRYFGGMSEQETAAALGASLRTVQRDWTKARAWLAEAFGSP
jgi:RNA polymerase sigma-70 factor, ECF subfamily